MDLPGTAITVADSNLAVLHNGFGGYAAALDAAERVWESRVRLYPTAGPRQPAASHDVLSRLLDGIVSDPNVGLRVLREVTERGTFTAAAQALGYTQSAVSRQVAALEQATGVRLFDRCSGGVRPTGSCAVRRTTPALCGSDSSPPQERCSWPAP